MNPLYIQGVKFAIAAAGTGLLLWGAVLSRAGRPQRLRRLRDVSLGILGVVSALCWWNFFQFHHDRYLHPTDFFHYYVGAKYFPELGYTGLYECMAAAELESSRRYEVANRVVRNLETNTLETAKAIIEDPTRCTQRFSPERWEDFKVDIAWFRKQLSDDYWAKIYIDHGFNGTPAFTILGAPLANLRPATDASIFALTLPDWLILLVMWGFVWRAFGWRVMCVALIFWGTNYPAHFGWTGGSFLRQGWLAALVVGLCCLRMQRPLAAGFALACAASLRIFPAAVFVGLGLAALWQMAARRQLWLSPESRRVAAGALLALTLVLTLTGLGGRGLSAWPEFADNMRLHLRTPGVNRIGLETLVSFDPDRRLARSMHLPPDERIVAWHDTRLEMLERRQLVFWGLAVGFVALLAAAVRRREDWVAAALGVGLVPVLADPTSYYLGALVAFGFLSLRHEGLGAALCGLAAITLVAHQSSMWPDEVFVWLSVCVLLFVTLATAVLAVEPRSSSPADTD